MDLKEWAGGLPAAAAELREQLTMVSAVSQFLETGADDPVLDSLASLNRSVFRMLRTVNRLELACRLTDENELRCRAGKLDLAEWTEELARKMAGILAGAAIRLEWDLPEEMPFCLDRELLACALPELVAFGARSGDRLKLSLTRQGEKAIFTLTVQGEAARLPLVPPELRKETEDPGLSLVRSIAGLHGGGLVTCLDGGKCRSLTLILPRQAEPTDRDLAQPLPAVDDGGFDPVLVAFSDLLPAGEFRPTV